MSATDIFKTDPSYQLYIQRTLDELANLCANLSASKGFHDDERELLALIDEFGPKYRSWVEAQLFQAELARAMSECAEAIEGVRKPHPDKHVPSLDNTVVELADAIIRICDIAGKRNLPLGRALVEKLLANIARPYKHGKNS
jgi:NTP pyrophosphatase (non-canonical NTP hydrolase)